MHDKDEGLSSQRARVCYEDTYALIINKKITGYEEP